MNLWIYPLVAGLSFLAGFGGGRLLRRYVAAAASLALIAIALSLSVMMASAIAFSPLPFGTVMLIFDALGLSLGAFCGAKAIDVAEQKKAEEEFIPALLEKVEAVGVAAQAVNIKVDELELAQIALSPLEDLASVEADKADFLAVLKPHLDAGRAAVEAAGKALADEQARLAKVKEEFRPLVARVQANPAAQASRRLRLLLALAEMLVGNAPTVDEG